MSTTLSTPGITLAPEPVLALRVWHVYNHKLHSMTLSYVYDHKLRSVTRIQTEWPRNNALKCTCISILRKNGCCGSGRESDTLLPHAHGQCGIYGVSGGAITRIRRHRPSTDGYTEYTFYYNWDVHNRDALIHQLTKYWVGIVALWGRVIYGESGIYRAEYGYPVALFDANGAHEIAENYGILVLPLPSSVDELPGTFEHARSLLKERRL